MNRQFVLEKVREICVEREESLTEEGWGVHDDESIENPEFVGELIAELDNMIHEEYQKR